MNFETENNDDSYHNWQTPAKQWSKIKHLVKEMRNEPTVAEHLLWQELKGHKFDKLNSEDNILLINLLLLFIVNRKN